MMKQRTKVDKSKQKDFAMASFENQTTTYMGLHLLWSFILRGGILAL